jgi:hypothetical protein
MCEVLRGQQNKTSKPAREMGRDRLRRGGTERERERERERGVGGEGDRRIRYV